LSAGRQEGVRGRAGGRGGSVQGEAIRNIVKWDYQPASVEGVPDAFARAYSIMMGGRQGPISYGELARGTRRGRRRRVERTDQPLHSTRSFRQKGARVGMECHSCFSHSFWVRWLL
jgi:hypothetical protein